MANDFIVTRSEFNDGLQEQVNNIQTIMDVVNALKCALQAVENAHNTLTEVVGLNRYILEQFVPMPLLEKAVREYKQQREAMIKAEAHGPSA